MNAAAMWLVHIYQQLSNVTVYTRPCTFSLEISSSFNLVQKLCHGRSLVLGAHRIQSLSSATVVQLSSSLSPDHDGHYDNVNDKSHLHDMFGNGLERRYKI